MHARGVTLVLALCGLLCVQGFDRRRFPGPYCKTRQPQQCCPGRDDQCTVPIHDTLCYCDQFCGEHSVEDCCPDFQDVCNAKQPAQQEENQCIKEERFYQIGDLVKSGCNECTCVRNAVSETLSRLQWSCTDEACINEPDLVSKINSGNYGWSAATYDKFDGISLKDGVNYFLGTEKPKPEVVKLSPLLFDSNDALPTSFDARDAWPKNYIHEAMDQGRCASSWAFSTAGVAADRWSIQSRGAFKDQLSVQNMISCARFIQGCDGGKVEDAWYFLQSEGAVEAVCYPYISGETRKKEECKYLDEITCPDGHDVHVHQTTPPYRIAANERQIMKEILSNGPVQAIITVYPDFYLYQRGVYMHTNEEAFESKHDHTLSGTHSVRIIGWGEENGVKYWICVNSWGRRWGEDGMIKIKRGSNESGVEDFVIGVWPKVEKHELGTDTKLHRRI